MSAIVSSFIDGAFGYFGSRVARVAGILQCDNDKLRIITLQEVPEGDALPSSSSSGPPTKQGGKNKKVKQPVKSLSLVPDNLDDSPVARGRPIHADDRLVVELKAKGFQIMPWGPWPPTALPLLLRRGLAPLANSTGSPSGSCQTLSSPPPAAEAGHGSRVSQGFPSIGRRPRSSAVSSQSSRRFSATFPRRRRRRKG